MPQSLKNYVTQKGAFCYDEIKPAVLNLMQQLCQLHQSGMCHNDICPDNIMVDVDESGELTLALQPSPFTDVPNRGAGKMNWKEDHDPYFAPENYIGETSFLSDQYQLATTLYFCVHGTTPCSDCYRKPASSYLFDIKETFACRDFDANSDEFTDSCFERNLIKALRLNPTERFSSVEEWMRMLEGNSSEMVTESQYEEEKEESTVTFEMRTPGSRRYKIIIFFAFPFTYDNPYSEYIGEAYRQIGISVFEREYWLADGDAEYQSWCIPLSEPRHIFRIMMASTALDSNASDIWRQESHRVDINRIVNHINLTSRHIKMFYHSGKLFSIYEEGMDESSDFSSLIADAHQELLEVEKLLEKLLDGCSEAFESQKPQSSKNSAAVFRVTRRNQSAVYDLVQKVNIALAGAKCVIRDDKVCIESENPLDDSIATFDYIKNYAYQAQEW